MRSSTRQTSSIDSDTRSYLMTRLGADQALSRAEVAKLALYRAAARDASRRRTSRRSSATAPRSRSRISSMRSSGGETKEALRQLAATCRSRHRTVGRRFRRSGGTSRSSTASPRRKPPASASSRRFESLRPRPHFKREKAFVADIAGASARQRLLEALPLIQEAVKRARAQSGSRARLRRAAGARRSRGEGTRAGRPTSAILVTRSPVAAGLKPVYPRGHDVTSGTIMDQRRKRLADLIKERSFRRGNFTLGLGQARATTTSTASRPCCIPKARACSPS